MNKLLTIIKKTYAHQVKSWTFFLFIIAPLFIISILGIVGYFTEKNSHIDSEYKAPIAVIANSKVEKNFFIKNSNGRIKFSLSNENQAQKKLKQGIISGYLVVDMHNHQLVTKFYGKHKLSLKNEATLLKIINDYQTNINTIRSRIDKQQLEILNISPKFSQIVDKKTLLKNMKQN